MHPHIPPTHPADLLTPVQTSQVLGVSVHTLATWRSTGRHGLPFVKVGSCVRYRSTDITAWLQGRQHPTGATATTEQL